MTTIAISDATLARFNKAKGIFQSQQEGQEISAEEFLNSMLEAFEQAQRIGEMIVENNSTNGVGQ